MESIQSHRKDEHLSLAEKFYSTVHQTDSFDGIRIIHNSLPELGLNDATLQTTVAGLSFVHPYYIEAITGGSQTAAKVNSQLSKLAAKHNLAMAVGSASILLADESAKDSFAVIRQQNPNGLVFANVSAHTTVEQAEFIIDFMKADALEVHVNSAQEIVMPEGEREFYWLENLKQLKSSLSIPVIVKEVGFGMSHETVEQLAQIGINNVNVSGHGGTNFVEIENRRNHQNDYSYLSDWGQTTVESLLDCGTVTNVNLFASGGVTTPLDVIKCGVLGAQAVGVAGYFLHILTSQGYDALDLTLTQWSDEVQKLLLLCGSKSFADLKNTPYVLNSELINFLNQRQK